MSFNNRFVKFKFEKLNDKLKLDDINIINILFYSEINILLSKVLSKDKMKKSKRWAPFSIINFMLLNDWLNQITPKKTHVETKTLFNVCLNM